MYDETDTITAPRNFDPEVSRVPKLYRNVRVFMGVIVLPADGGRGQSTEEGAIKCLECILLYGVVREVQSTRVLRIMTVRLLTC